VKKTSRKFSVHPSIIYSVISRQAGTLGKAVLEGIMNSVDAGASRIDIEISRTKVLIKDDGKGFQSKEEIEKWFEVFGFPHEAGDRIYGEFGVGRGQLFSFCSAIWRTGPFQMDVDLKHKGLDYDLDEELEAIPGVTIEGTFYTPLLTSEIAAFQKELTELSKYAQVPVFLDGKQISKTPANEKWDFDTKDAWIRVNDSSSLAVYNLGVLVRSYSAYQFGCGGVVVTKPGVKLALNMARNDILIAECPVWKRIRQKLQKESDERVRTKRTRMTEAELENFAKRFVAGELPYSEVENVKLVTDIVGRRHTLYGFVSSARRRPATPLTKAEDGSRMGERAHSRGLAFVLAPATLARFGVESVEEFRSLMLMALERGPYPNSWLTHFFGNVTVTEDVREAAPTLREGHDVLENKDLTKHELAALPALEEMSNIVGRRLFSLGLINGDNSRRQVYLGVSDVDAAWTDGHAKIVVERRTLDLMKSGIGGFVGLANIFVHELLHDSSDVGSPTHDHEFYKRYHDATSGNAGILDQVVMKGMRKWVVALRARDLRVPAEMSRHLDQTERMEGDALQAAAA